MSRNENRPTWKHACHKLANDADENGESDDETNSIKHAAP
jgi:hypothetical protein